MADPTSRCALVARMIRPRFLALWLLSPNDNPYHNWCVRAALCVIGGGFVALLIVLVMPV